MIYQLGGSVACTGRDHMLLWRLSASITCRYNCAIAGTIVQERLHYGLNVE